MRLGIGSRRKGSWDRADTRQTEAPYGHLLFARGPFRDSRYGRCPAAGPHHRRYRVQQLGQLERFLEEAVDALQPPGTGQRGHLAGAGDEVHGHVREVRIPADEAQHRAAVLFAEAQVLKTVAPAIDSQYTPNLSAYTTAFAYNDYNVAAAQAVLIAVAAFVLSFAFLKFTNRKSS